MDKLTANQILQFASLLLQLGISAVQSRAKTEGKTVDEILSEADTTWKQAQTEAEELLKDGHNG